MTAGANAQPRTRVRTDLALPLASIQYRLKAWRAFQRALDPLAAPKPLRPPQQK